MDWENERYVRVYTRDTADLLGAGWEGRAVLWEMCRKCDRAGVIDGDEETLPDLLRIPREVVEVGLERLLKRGVVEAGRHGFVLPNFLEAQEAKQSDRHRQRESRARRRDMARAGSILGDVTSRDTSERIPVTEPPDSASDVTAGHSASQPVTPSLAVPSLAEPKPLSRQSRASAHVAPSVPTTAPPDRSHSSELAPPEPPEDLGVDPRAREIAEHIRSRCPKILAITPMPIRYAESLLNELDGCPRLTVADVCDAMTEADHDAGPEMSPHQVRGLMRRFVKGVVKRAKNRTSDPEAIDDGDDPEPKRSPRPPDYEDRIARHQEALAASVAVPESAREDAATELRRLGVDL